MNASQTKYARERATQIYNKKRTAINDIYKAVPVADEDKIEALRLGKFTIAEEKKGYGNYWYTRINFTDFPVADVEKRDKELSDLQLQYQKLQDELVLGDVQEALELLKAFEIE